MSSFFDDIETNVEIKKPNAVKEIKKPLVSIEVPKSIIKETKEVPKGITKTIRIPETIFDIKRRLEEQIIEALSKETNKKKLIPLIHTITLKAIDKAVNEFGSKYQ